MSNPRITYSCRILILSVLACLALNATVNAEVDTSWSAYFDASESGDDQVIDMQVDAVGCVYLVGVTDADPNVSTRDYDIVVLKYSPNGNLIWSWSTANPAARYEYPADLDVNDAGEVVMSGTSGASFSTGNLYSAHLDQNGHLLWSGTYAGSFGGRDHGFGVIHDGTGGAYAGGMSQTTSSLQFELVVIRFANDGTPVWTYFLPTISTATYSARYIEPTSDGNLLIGCQFYGGTPSIGDYGLIKMSTDGDTLWTRTFDGGSYLREEPVGMGQDSLGNIYIGGYSDSINSVGARNYNYHVVKYSPDGDFIWAGTAEVIADGHDLARSMAVSSDGRCAITGRTNEDFTIASWDSDGTLAWVWSYNGPANAFDEGVHLTYTADGTLLATGQITPVGDASNILSVKFDVHGSVVWSRELGLGTGWYESPTQIRAAETLPIYVAGLSIQSNNNQEITLVKYDLCECPCHADPHCDGLRSDVGDVMAMIDHVFGGQVESIVRCVHASTDVDCSGSSDIRDVVKVINVAFRGGTIESEYCQYTCPE